MPAVSRKAIAERTIGKAAEARRRWASENRGPTTAEESQFNALLDAAEAALQCGPIPRNMLFEAWVAKGLHDDDGMSDELLGHAVQGNGKSNLRFYDDRGRCVRGVGPKESFKSAMAEYAADGHDNSDFKLGEKLAADGESVGSMIKAMLFGPSSSGQRAALSGSESTAGGFTLPWLLVAEFIDRLRRRAVLTQLGVTILPMPTESMSIVRITGDPTATWRRENTDVAESEPSFGAQNFTAKNLGVIIKCSREGLEDSGMIEEAIMRTLSAAFAIEVDRAGLQGEGVAEPLGILDMEGVNDEAAIGAITDYQDVLAAWRKIMDDNAPDPNGLVISTREWQKFAGLEDSTGQPLMKPPAIENLPMLATTAIPTTLGGGGNESYAVLGHWPDLIMAMRSELRIEMLKELFAGKNQVGFLATLRMDTGVFHAESFCKLSGITPT